MLFVLTACSSGPDMPETEPEKKPTEAREWVVKWQDDPEPEFLETVEVLRENKEDHTMLVKVKPDIDQEKWRAKWILNDNVEYIQPNLMYKLNYETDERDERQAADLVEKPARDFFLHQIHAYQAWEVWEPQREVVIAVIDTGVDTDHPFIAPHLVKQTNIVNPGAGAEDIMAEDVLLPEEQGKTPREIEEMYADDETAKHDYWERLEAVGHGTNVTGVLLQTLGLIDGEMPAAATETTAKIMPIKVMGYVNGEKVGGSDFDMSEAIRMAVHKGADIINLSLGDWAYSKNARDAVQMAEEAGVLVIAAAGNWQSGVNEPIFYPAAFPGVLAVGGVTRDGEYDEYSNHGPGLDLTAPDESIWTIHVGDDEYRWRDGNSFATPQVTAVAAMVMQQYPYMSPAQVRSLLRQTANSSEGDWNPKTGYGVVDAFRAMTEIPQASIYKFNHSQEQAARVSVNDRVEAVLEASHEEDWYVFDIPNFGTDLNYRVNVRIRLSRPLDDGVEVRIKRPGDAEMVSYTVKETEDLLLTVPPGELYLALRFQEEEVSPYLGYELETEILTTPDAYEDNDHQWHAYDLTLEDEETYLEGTFHTEGDKDWYRIKTPDAGNVTIEVAASTPRMDLALFVQQLGGNGVLVDESGPMGKEELQIRVEAGGVYYIRVHDLNIHPTVGMYHMWVTYEPIVSDMNEGNNRSDQATSLTGAQGPVMASLHGRSDIDWYRFRVPQDTEVTVYVTGMEGRVRAEITVYEAGLSALAKHVIASEESEFTWTESLPAGDYYVRVRPLDGVNKETPYAIGYIMPESGHVEADDMPIDG